MTLEQRARLKALIARMERNQPPEFADIEFLLELVEFLDKELLMYMSMYSECCGE